jgi:hypothetical protein
VREGKAEADTFAPALGKVLPVAAAYGASFEDISAAIAALSRGGLSAGTAAIYVRQTLSQLLKPSKQAQEVLKGVGTSAEEIRDNIQKKGLFPALIELRDQIGGIEKAGDFTKVFGNVRALTAVLSLVGPAAEQNAQIFERMNNSTGDLAIAFNAYSETIDSKFNRSMASQQAALIELGDALKPIVSSLLSVATALTKAFGAFVKTGIGKVFARIASGGVLMIAVMASVLKTFSALIRLGSNVNIMLFGQQFQYSATTKQIQRYVQGTMTVATAHGTVVKTIGMWVPANGILAMSIRGVAMAMNVLTTAMGYAFMAITTVLLIIEGIRFAMRFFGDDTENSAEKINENLSKVTTLLDEAAKYGRTTIEFGVDIDYSTTSRSAINERLRKELDEAAPGLIDQLRDIANMQGNEAVAQYIKALINTKFAGNTEEFKQNLINFFTDTLLLDQTAIANAIIPTGTGDALTDALISQGVINANALQNEWTKSFKLDPTSTVQEIADVFAEGVHASENGGYEASKVFGETFTEGIQQTGQLNPIIETFSKFRDQWEATGVSTQKQSEIMTEQIGSALKGLSGDFDLIEEKGGNFRNIFRMKGNKDIAKRLIKETFLLDDVKEVEAVYVRLNQGMAKLPTSAKGNIAAFDVLRSVYDEYKQKGLDAANANQDLDESMSALADRFSQGYAESVQNVIDQYDAATAAVKEFERGQQALMGVQRDMTDAQIDFRDAMRDMREAARESGGDLFSGSVNADKAQSALLDAMDSVLGVVNQFAARGDEVGASEALGEGISRIVSDGVASGLDENQIMAFLDMHNFGPQMLDTLKGQVDEQGKKAEAIGQSLTDGLARGIEQGRPAVSLAIDALGDDVIDRLKKRLGIKSPSVRMAKEVGEPSAQGVAKGFEKEMKGKSAKIIDKSMSNAIMAAYKSGGYKGAGAFFKKFLERKDDVETPATDYVKAVTGRMKDIISSLSSYIKSQLNFRKAQADLAKLINMQRGLDDRRKKAARQTEYARTRFGMGGGAQVTGYEQAQIDQLQLDFERTSRDYAMGRATYVELVDAEIALFEARAAAAEVADEVISAENNFLDASVEVENKSLNLAAAVVNVNEAYAAQIDAAIELYSYHKELADVYNKLSEATGIASGQLQIGQTDLLKLGGEVGKYGGYVSTVGGYVSTLGNNVTITGQKFNTTLYGPEGVFANIVKVGGNVNSLTKSIGADFANLAKGLLNKESQMWKDLNSLGPAIFKAIEDSANEQFATSPLQLVIPVNTIISSSGGVSNTNPEENLGGKLSYSEWLAKNKILESRARNAAASAFGIGSQFVGRPEVLNTPAIQSYITSWLMTEYQKYRGTGRAVGGPVTGSTPYMVGERGPEMFVPNVSGTIVTASALDRYTRTTQRQVAVDSGRNGQNIVVTVNNPVPAAAEDSITRRMKVLANSGLFG